MEFIDTHCHLDDEVYAPDRDEVIARARQAGVIMMLQADIDSSERDAMLALTDARPDVLRPMLGLYPGSVEGNWKEEIDRMLAYLDGSRTFVAIGEIGLDYHYGTLFREEQKEAFRVQLELAARLDLPVNIHLRDATEDFFSIMEDCRGLGLRGNLHAFSGSFETFMRLSRLGEWHVGIGGVLTFKNASIAREIHRFPMDRILLETDAPYLSPTPHRGERNESSRIPLIASCLAALTGMDIAEVAETTTNNAKHLFNL